MSDLYGTGPGMVIFKGAAFRADVILTGLLGTLEGLEDMVIIETSLTGVDKIGVFSNRISWLLIRLWMPIFNNGRWVNEDEQR